jgi:hypothetical protein
MKRSKMKIKVLRNYDGFRGELVEEIERMPVRVKNCDRKGRKIGPEYDTVSYKGERHAVFCLPQSYGALAGLCISIDPVW